MKSYILILLLLISQIAISQKLSLYDLSCDHKINPIGIDNTSPRLSWKTRADSRNVLQSAYSLRVASTSDFAKGNIVWQSGKVNSDESILLSYKGPALESGKRYYWQVKVWDNHNKESAWSTPAFWEMGLLKEADWKAQWIEPQQDTAKSIPALMVRKDFALKKDIADARVYITCHGLYEFFINGKRVGDQVLMPGWTSYNERLQYQVYDITNLLQRGNNAAGAVLGEGWYRGPLGWGDNWGIWGKKLGLLCQLQIKYTDGTEEILGTDNTWKGTSDSPIVMNGIYEGETYDARKEINGWATAGFNDKAWQPVTTADYSKNILVATETVSLRRIQEIKPIKIFRTPKGTQVVDFGQNMVGWIRLKLKAKAGDKITVRHAEVLDKHGEFYTDNLRGSKATMTYIGKGGTEETYEPHFTFFGFRYIAVDGFPGDLKPDNFTGIVVHSDMKPTGSFTCSHPLINQLQKNIQWGQKGNFLDVPTDCPQRDERLGWTGDAQAFYRTAAYNMNVAAFFAKWLKDLAADQLDNGTVPPVIPNIMLDNIAGSAGWADASTIIPWNMYLVYGDKKVLEEQYESMKAWVGYMEANSKNNLWNKGFHFGDWLFYRPFDDVDGRAAVTDKYLIAQCFWAHSTQLIINAAQVLGKTEDVKTYTDRLKNIKDAFVKEYVTPNGRLISSTQTAYVLALNFDILPENLRKQAAERLADNVKDYDYHLTTGFLGTPYLCHVLTRYGYTDVAYKLLLQETYPSWLYPVKMGATTIWERWDGQKPDSTFQNPGMNSFNHYAYGAIGDWLYRTVAGIDTEESAPGYKQITIKPHPGGNLKNVAADFQSNYGLISSQWKMNGNQFILDVDIPANTKATIHIPSKSIETVTENSKPLTGVKDIKVKGQADNYSVVEVGSGKYHFVSQID